MMKTPPLNGKKKLITKIFSSLMSTNLLSVKQYVVSKTDISLFFLVHLLNMLSSSNLQN